MSSLLSIADYAVIAIMLAISAGVGLFFRFTGGRQKTTREYLLADKNMGTLPVSFSLMATVMSAIALLGWPAETYFYGAKILMLEIFFPIGIIVATYGIVPVYFDAEVDSIFAYLEKRYGKAIKLTSSLLYTIQMILYMPVVVYAPSLALSTVTGFPLWTSILSMTIVCTFYSTMGGLKAVLWTDLFQGILMLFTIFALIIKGCSDLGGFYKVLETARDGGRLEVFNTETDLRVRYTLWNTMTHGTVSAIFYFGTTYAMVQRVLSCGTLKKAQRSLLWNIPLVLIFKGSSVFLGIVIYSYFHDCDPIKDKSQHITSGDQLVPYFILKMFNRFPGLPGLCIAGVLSAALSTMSSVVNSLVAVTVEDYIKPIGKCSSFKDSTMALLAKFLAIFYGGLCLLLTLVLANAKGVIEISIVILGMVGGPTLGVFWLGVFTTNANELGSLIGLLTGFAINAWMGFGSLYSKSKYPSLPMNTTGCISAANSSLSEAVYSSNSSQYLDPDISVFNDLVKSDTFSLYKISYFWFAAFSFLTTVISGYLASFITNIWIEQKEVDSLYLSPFIRKWFSPSPKPLEEKEYLQLSDRINKIDVNRDTIELGDRDKKNAFTKIQ